MYGNRAGAPFNSRAIRPGWDRLSHGFAPSLVACCSRAGHRRIYRGRDPRSACTRRALRRSRAVIGGRACSTCVSNLQLGHANHGRLVDPEDPPGLAELGHDDVVARLVPKAGARGSLERNGSGRGRHRRRGGRSPSPLSGRTFQPERPPHRDDDERENPDPKLPAAPHRFEDSRPLSSDAGIRLAVALSHGPERCLIGALPLQVTSGRE